MELVAAIGWIVGLLALGAAGWGQQKLGEVRERLERAMGDTQQAQQQLGDALRESKASLTRVREQAASDRRFGQEPLARDLLDVIDSFERAAEQLPEGPASEGVSRIHQQLMATLSRHGVTRIPALGLPFDPAVHEALGGAVADAAPDTVIQEVAGGYRLHDRVLRAAKVVLAQPPPASAGDGGDDVPPSAAASEDDDVPLERDDGVPLEAVGVPEARDDAAPIGVEE